MDRGGPSRALASYLLACVTDTVFHCSKQADKKLTARPWLQPLPLFCATDRAWMLCHADSSMSNGLILPISVAVNWHELVSGLTKGIVTTKSGSTGLGRV